MSSGEFEVGQQIEIEEVGSDHDVIEAGEPVVVDPTTRRILGSVSSFYAGPLPPSQELDSYNRVVPGLADTIVTEWRTETAHRRRLEQAGQSGAIKAHRRGQYIGLLIVLFVVGCGTYLTNQGRSTVGIAMILGPLAGVAGVVAFQQIRGPASRTPDPGGIF